MLTGVFSNRSPAAAGPCLPAFAVAAIAVLIATFAVTAAPAKAAPATEPARSALPNRIAVVGDSISAGTGTESLNIFDPDQTHPNNNWSTGTTNNSLYLRLLAINPAINGNRQNTSDNGKRMSDAAGQANSLNTGTDLVTIQMGGNDLCKDTIADMTSVANYRNQFVQFLNAVRNRMPNALILVASVPDIFNLWYVRGAPGSVNGQESSNAGTARAFWDNIFGGFVPCRSLITSPTSTSASDTLRRNQVRQRNIELNYVLQEECAKVIRCRFDDWRAFDLSSNRDISTEANRQKYNRSTNIADWGNYQGIVPPSQWGFTDADVSTADHFHPSNSGHRKLAEGAWESGYDFSDRTYPQVASKSSAPAPMANGVHRVRPSVTVNWSDAAGIKGIEYRVRTDSDGGGGGWTGVIGSSVSVPMAGNGVSYLETRAFDLNGNRSASNMTRVDFDPTDIPAPALSGVPEEFTNQTEASIAAALEPGLTLECSFDDGPFETCATPIGYPEMDDGTYSLRIRQTDGQGNTSPVSTASWTVNTESPDPPTITSAPAAFTNQRNLSIEFETTLGNTVECRLDGGQWSACSSPWQLTGLDPGEHSVAIRQTSPSGVVSAESRRAWTIDITPPGNPQITDGPPQFTNRLEPIFEFSGEEGAVFECRLERPGSVGPWQPCTSPRTISGATLNNVTYTFRVRQTDLAGNISVSDDFRSWTLDRTPPNAPSVSGAPTGTVTSSSASISLTATEAGSTFECSTNDSAWIACQSPVMLSELPEGPITFEARQVDRAGNAGAGTTASWQVKTFTAPPFITGGPPAVTNGRTNSITFTGEVGGSFACSLNGATFTPCSSPQTFPEQADGNYTLRIRQTDLIGTASEPFPVTWRVDATPPGQPNLTQPLPNATSSTSQSIPFTGEAGATFECRLNGGEWDACTSPFATGALPDGRQRFEVRQTDEAGNTGSARSFEWLIKTTKPAPPTINGAPKGTVRAKTATMTFTGESGARIECRLNGGAWAPCPSPMSVTGLAEGTNRMEARQVDLAGNESDVVGLIWTVDTVAPRLKGAVRASRSKKASVIRSAFDPKAGKPARIEWSTSKKRPSAGAAPANARTVTWKASITVRGAAKVTWVRVLDQVGNASAWYPVR